MRKLRIFAGRNVSGVRGRLGARFLAGIAVGLAGLKLNPAAHSATPTEVQPAEPVVSTRVFNLLDYGAKADGRSPNDTAFRRAIDAVREAGGGTLIVPAGDYLTGPIELCSRLDLRLEADARITFSPKPEDYPAATPRPRALLLARNCEDIVLSGKGVIDGQGQPWWDEMRGYLRAVSAQLPATQASRPRLVSLEDCRRVRIEGITLQNSPMLQCVLMRCDDVTVDSIRILAPNTKENHAYNTDGIDPVDSHRVRIVRCFIDTGDDCIALKGGGTRGVTDVLIEDCDFRNGHGCSIGSGTAPHVRNVTVRRCTFEGTNVGIQIKSARDRGGIVENLYCSDLVMKKVPIPIGLSAYYPGRTAPKPGEAVELAPITAKTPVLRDIMIRNVTITEAAEAGRVLGLPEQPIERLTLENIRIEAVTGLRVAYAKEVTLREVKIVVASGAPVLAEHGVTGLHIETP
jgi:polygalacturonase